MTPAALAVVFVLSGSARYDVQPFPPGEQAGKMRVTLEPGSQAGHVSVRLEAMGHACVLDASRSRDGALAFTIPAACAVDLNDPDARGHVDARLRSGKGTVRGDRLTLELSFDVAGRVATRMERTTLNVLGAAVVVPEGWSPEVPIQGTVTSKGTGVRQRP
jgi:hypothetical protein